MEKNFEYYAKQWLELKRVSVKESTYERYRDILRIHIMDVFQNLYIEEISNEIVINFFNC